MDTDLTLADELMLLALDDRGGAVHNERVARRLPYALAGALLMDLVYSGRVTVEGDMVRVVTTFPFVDPVLTATLAILAPHEQPRTLSTWVHDLAPHAHASIPRLVDGLVRRGILAAQAQQGGHIYPLRQPQIEARALARIKYAVTANGLPDFRTAILLCLIQAADLVPVLFPVSDRPRAFVRAQEIAAAVVIDRALLDVEREAGIPVPDTKLTMEQFAHANVVAKSPQQLSVGDVVVTIIAVVFDAIA